MSKSHSLPPHGNSRALQTSTNDQSFVKSVDLHDADSSSNGDPNTSDYLAEIPDLRVSGERIRHFAGLDLGELVDLPSKREDLVALSIRMDAAFSSLVKSTFQWLSEDYQEIAPETRDAVSRELALGFVGRYGTLALFSANVLRVLWSAQRLKSQKGPEFLRQVGKKLAVFVATQKGWSPQRSIDIAFTLGKPLFLGELEQLSRDLGASESDEPKADLLLRFVRTGKYEMLRLNLVLLEQFLGRDKAPAERLAQYGARRLTSENGEPITPDWFFYTWVAWIVNKKPGTVRRLIQTAETRFRARISSYEKSNKR